MGAVLGGFVVNVLVASSTQAQTCTDGIQTGSCQVICASGTEIPGATGCTNPNLGECCVSGSGGPGGGSGGPGGGSGGPGGGSDGPGPAPPAKVEYNTTFLSPLQYETVNTLLGSILGWLQGIVATLALVFVVIGGFLYITSGGDSGRAETAKKCLGAAVIGFALAVAAPSFLREIAIILGWGQNLGNLPGTPLSVLQILSNILTFLLSIVGVIAIIMLVIGGIMYLTATGDEDRLDTAKDIVKYSIIGIAIALASLVIVSQVANFFE